MRQCTVAVVVNDLGRDPRCLCHAEGRTIDVGDDLTDFSDVRLEESLEIRTGTADQDNVCHVDER